MHNMNLSTVKEPFPAAFCQSRLKHSSLAGMVSLVKRQSQALRELGELGAFTEGSTSFAWTTEVLIDSMGSLWALQQ